MFNFNKIKDEITKIIYLSFFMKKKDGSGSQDGLLLMWAKKVFINFAES